MFDYFYNCLRKACLYFSLPTSHQDLAEYNKDRKAIKSEHLENKDQCESKNLECCDIKEPLDGVIKGQIDTEKVVEKENDGTVTNEKDVNFADPVVVRTGKVIVTENDVQKFKGFTDGLVVRTGKVIVDEAKSSEAGVVIQQQSSCVSSSLKKKSSTVEHKDLEELTDDAGILEHEIIENSKEESLSGSGSKDDVDNLEKDVVESENDISDDFKLSELTATLTQLGAENCDISESSDTGSTVEMNKNVEDIETIDNEVPCQDELVEVARNFVDTVIENAKEVVLKHEDIADHNADTDEENTESESDSDLEIKPAVLSPAIEKENVKARASSPANAEYNFEFSAKTLTDGKVSGDEQFIVCLAEKTQESLFQVYGSYFRFTI